MYSKIFSIFANKIEDYAFINGEAAYKPLADKINQAVADIQTAAKARTTLASNAAKNKNEGEQK